MSGKQVFFFETEFTGGNFKKIFPKQAQSWEVPPCSHPPRFWGGEVLPDPRQHLRAEPKPMLPQVFIVGLLNLDKTPRNTISSLPKVKVQTLLLCQGRLMAEDEALHFSLHADV